jgi:hypothetical protein
MTADALPRSLAAIVKAIGEEDTFRLISALGGTRVYVPRVPQGDTLLVNAIGFAAAAKLGQEIGGDHIDLPLATRAVTRWLHRRGLSNNEIARVQRISAKTVGRRLGAGDPRQLDFLQKLAR